MLLTVALIVCLLSSLIPGLLAFALARVLLCLWTLAALVAIPYFLYPFVKAFLGFYTIGYDFFGSYIGTAILACTCCIVAFVAGVILIGISLHLAPLVGIGICIYAIVDLYTGVGNENLNTLFAVSYHAGKVGVITGICSGSCFGLGSAVHDQGQQ